MPAMFWFDSSTPFVRVVEASRAIGSKWMSLCARLNVSSCRAYAASLRRPQAAILQCTECRVGILCHQPSVTGMGMRCSTVCSLYSVLQVLQLFRNRSFMGCVGALSYPICRDVVVIEVIFIQGRNPKSKENRQTHGGSTPHRPQASILGD